MDKREMRLNMKVGKKAEIRVVEPVNKSWTVFVSIFIVLIALLAISLFSSPSVEAKFKDVDVVVRNSAGLPGDVYYKNEKTFTLSGWESMLTYDGKKDRLFGEEIYKEIIFDENGKAYTVIFTGEEVLVEPLTTNPDKVTKIGWFMDLDKVDVQEDTSLTEKEVAVLLEGEEIKEAELTYQFYRKQPYFIVNFNVNAEDTSKLGEFAYGIKLQGYDIYSENGAVLENDNEVIKMEQSVEIILREDGRTTTEIPEDLQESISNKIDLDRNPVSRSGSIHEVNYVTSQIFYNPEERRTIIVYSPEATRFVNSFYWNVYWVYTAYNEGYPPIYFVILENSELTHSSDGWHVTSDDYSGSVNNYIGRIIEKAGEK